MSRNGCQRVHLHAQQYYFCWDILNKQKFITNLKGESKDCMKTWNMLILLSLTYSLKQCWQLLTQICNGGEPQDHPSNKKVKKNLQRM